MTAIRKTFRRLFRYRSIRLTPDGIRFVLLAVGIGVASINTGNNLLYLLFAMMLSLIVISGILSERCFKHIQVSRRLPFPFFANQPANAALVIVNRSVRFPIFSVRMMDVAEGKVSGGAISVSHLFPEETRVQSYPLMVTQRGSYLLEGVKFMTRFPFGLFVKAATIPLEANMLVYPEVRTLPPMLLNELVAWGHDQAVPHRGQGTTLHNLRLYQPGDDSRSIHWRTTARKSLLIVRETEVEDVCRVAIVLQVFHPDPLRQLNVQDNFEKAVILAASLAVFFTARHYEVRLIIGEQELPYGIGEPHLMKMLALLAVCQPVLGTQRTKDLEGFIRGSSNEPSLHVLAWSDVNMPQLTPDARAFLASDYL